MIFVATTTGCIAGRQFLLHVNTAEDRRNGEDRSSSSKVAKDSRLLVQPQPCCQLRAHKSVPTPLPLVASRFSEK
jgi:hypothetical protein